MEFKQLSYVFSLCSRLELKNSTYCFFLWQKTKSMAKAAELMIIC